MGGWVVFKFCGNVPFLACCYPSFKTFFFGGGGVRVCVGGGGGIREGLKGSFVPSVFPVVAQLSSGIFT